MNNTNRTDVAIVQIVDILGTIEATGIPSHQEQQQQQARVTRQSQFDEPSAHAVDDCKACNQKYLNALITARSFTQDNPWRDTATHGMHVNQTSA